jgi:signal recognition particle GTPase
MGNILDLTKIFGKWGTQERRIVMVGLDGAGKTTVCAFRKKKLIPFFVNSFRCYTS